MWERCGLPITWARTNGVRNEETTEPSAGFERLWQRRILVRTTVKFRVVQLSLPSRKKKTVLPFDPRAKKPLRSLGRDLIPGPPEYEAEVLTTRQRPSVYVYKCRVQKRMKTQQSQGWKDNDYKHFVHRMDILSEETLFESYLLGYLTMLFQLQTVMKLEAGHKRWVD
jgi:hypothetical protein